MDRAQFLELRSKTENPRHVSADALGDRTLLYGYTLERATWHVYQKGGMLHLVVTGHGPHRHEFAEQMDAAALVPSKRLYPEACDHAFCTTLVGMGIHLPFTSFSDERPQQQFYGPVGEDEVMSPAV